MKIKVTVGTKKIGSECDRIIDVDDDATEEEIEQIAQETMWELIEFGWKRIQNEEKSKWHL